MAIVIGIFSGDPVWSGDARVRVLLQKKVGCETGYMVSAIAFSNITLN